MSGQPYNWLFCQSVGAHVISQVFGQSGSSAPIMAVSVCLSAYLSVFLLAYGEAFPYLHEVIFLELSANFLFHFCSPIILLCSVPKWSDFLGLWSKI